MIGETAPQKPEISAQDVMDQAFEAGTKGKEAQINELSKGYPKVSPQKYSDVYQVLKRKFDKTKRSGMGETDYLALTHTDWNLGKDEKMHGHEFVLVVSKDGKESHFFRNPKGSVREISAKERENMEGQKKAEKARVEEEEAAEIAEQAKDLIESKLSGKIVEVSPSSEGQAGELAKKVDKGLDGEGAWSMQDGAGRKRVVGVWLSSGKRYYYGDIKG
jgi:hypothetical protein